MRDLILSAFLLGLALFGPGCRKDSPPQLSVICELDGFGGGDCADPTGKYIYKKPSEMANYWATTQTDEANFASWCYGTAAPVVDSKLAQIHARIQQAKSRAMLHPGET